MEDILEYASIINSKLLLNYALPYSLNHNECMIIAAKFNNFEIVEELAKYGATSHTEAAEYSKSNKIIKFLKKHDTKNYSTYHGAGIILYKYIKGEKYFLLLKENDDRFSFPKGHPDKDEHQIQTAIRETFEETGYEYEKDYVITQNIALSFNKRYFWYGKLITDKSVKLDPKEHSKYIWVKYNDIMKLNTNADVKMWYYSLKNEMKNNLE